MRQLRRTEHPIQTSSSSPVASITDHAYQIPARVTLEIGMSDAMDSYSDVWTSATSKSVSAYQTLLSLQQTRTLVILTTRLDTYPNMLIESIQPSDSSRTRFGLRATVVFSQVYLADATAVSSSFLASSDDSSNPLSSQAQTTDTSLQGTVQSSAPSSALVTQNTVPASQQGGVPGAGDWSSVNVNQLENV